jgi:hypothetical protein
MGIIYSVPFLIWRNGRTDDYAPLVVVQIVTGIVLGPGVLGKIARTLREPLGHPIMIIFTNILLDGALVTSATFTALLLLSSPARCSPCRSWPRRCRGCGT